MNVIWEEHSRAVQNARDLFRNRTITADTFRKWMVDYGYTKTEIDAEIYNILLTRE